MVKTRLDELAVFGGAPAFPAPLHVGCPNIGDRRRFLDRVEDILDRRWLTNNGPYVQEFERRVAGRVGVRHCVALCNGTVALEIAARAAGLGGEVIVPAFTFVATAHALQWQAIRPVFCDIDPETGTIDPRDAERRITPRTTGIIGVHLWGRPCDVAALEDLARRRRLKLLFDAAHAFGCTCGGRPIGGFGDAEVFSFHATKFVNAFEGGAIATNDDDLAGRARLMRNFGFAGYDRVIYPGTNGKMSEVSAAMGLTSLESLDAFVAVNLRNIRMYREALAGIPGADLLAYDARETGNYQYVILFWDEAVTGLSRDAAIELLHAENILARRYFHPGCHRQEPYRSLPDAVTDLPHTERWGARVIALPTGSAVGEEEIRAVCSILHLVAGHGAAVRSRLETRRASP
jgi:dTDP-4-amino-4,6-dideoxygalactose transaminase